ncbi:MAG: hypothetical protein NC827_08385 [Candidatus Omnitrophica bacterium]|nr:hypothetical protein [Candidatus Omnitrophota bacterium]MCM8803307.1 hypothetical protein [Candidatus Omnitrophota bacterium]
MIVMFVIILLFFLFWGIGDICLYTMLQMVEAANAAKRKNPNPKPKTTPGPTSEKQWYEKEDEVDIIKKKMKAVLDEAVPLFQRLELCEDLLNQVSTMNLSDERVYALYNELETKYFGLLKAVYEEEVKSRKSRPA